MIELADNKKINIGLFEEEKTENEVEVKTTNNQETAVATRCRK